MLDKHLRTFGEGVEIEGRIEHDNGLPPGEVRVVPWAYKFGQWPIPFYIIKSGSIDEMISVTGQVEWNQPLFFSIRTQRIEAKCGAKPIMFLHVMCDRIWLKQKRYYFRVDFDKACVMRLPAMLALYARVKQYRVRGKAREGEMRL